MLDDAGRIDFAPELLDLVERLWCQYAHTYAPNATVTERLAGLLYAVTALKQDAEALARLLAAEPALAGTDVRALLADALEPLTAERLSALRAEMQRRGWL